MRVKGVVAFASSAVLFGVAGVSPAGCGSDDPLRGQRDDSGATPPFDPGDASGDSRVEIPLCATAEYPPGRATCASSRAPCDVELAFDRNNCGACGAACPPDQHRNPWEEEPSLEVTFLCRNGECEMNCQGGFGDCDGVPDNGCETDLSSTTDCGACGMTCQPGVPCSKGACGCAPPMVPCDGQCVDLSKDWSNCGACGNSCEDPAPPPVEHHLEMQCVIGQCKRACRSPYADCNADPSDGCEKDLSEPDPLHCGACDNACPSGTACDVYDVEAARMQCGCPAGLHKCPFGEDKYVCVDALTDPTHCGGCDVRCSYEQTAFSRPLCRGGLCGIVCEGGHANCNGFSGDGCEIDLQTDPFNCGACGHECDVELGQPCVHGKCVVIECSGGGGR